MGVVSLGGCPGTARGVNYLCSMSVKHILIKILDELSEEQFKKFKWCLEDGDDGKRISHRYLEGASRQETIDQMVSNFGSAGAGEKARETLEAVPRKDLADKLMKKVKDTLREILDELSEENFNKFKSCLVNGVDDKKISRPSLEGANREKTIEMVDHFGSFDALETAKKVLEDMKVAGKLMKKVPGSKTSSADEKGGAQGDKGGGAQGDNGGGAQGDKGGGDEELKVKLGAVVVSFGVGMLAAAAIVPSEMVILIALGAAGLGFLCEKLRGL
ncbi:uncharacterized protein LOC123349874 [Mauremys mutica]|uniref:uncharacterized protein LOC123349874 n=1 Tax=Mauremys mutica TaxID=74926 RepID=UPI001D16EAE5|nr:uncharacterized protein LOC123349874 [Mauremys mutica]